MGWRLQGVGVLCVIGSVLTCSSPNPNLRATRLPDGSIEVKGPLAGPFSTLEALAMNACAIVTSQPGASNGVYGFEYCALNYYSPQEKAYFLSYLSDFKNRPDTTTKTCALPRLLDDAGHRDAIIIGGVHGHPHNRRFSRSDLSIWSNWNPTRFKDKTTEHLWDRHLMLFYRERTGECRTYLYNQATRIVHALRNDKWVAIGKAYNDVGDIQMFEGQDWLP
ncbi:hypothetical protein [Hyalangium minutum]|uniref:hypothetical protein n=1 Tax=Hyalangium minutum TaxID=394096 RepID=UPI001F0AD518|nr:hypothetical protein [Hyalangium minutum]